MLKRCITHFLTKCMKLQHFPFVNSYEKKYATDGIWIFTKYVSNNILEPWFLIDLSEKYTISAMRIKMSDATNPNAPFHVSYASSLYIDRSLKCF